LSEQRDGGKLQSPSTEQGPPSGAPLVVEEVVVAGVFSPALLAHICSMKPNAKSKSGWRRSLAFAKSMFVAPDDSNRRTIRV
jgi:hypothetical protein